MRNTKHLIFSALFCALLAVSSFFSFPLPPFPGDVSLQTMIIYIMIIILPSSYSFISASLYVVLGLTGLPIFSQGGGLAYVLHPTFGYALGFAAAAFIGAYLFNSTKLQKKQFLCRYILSVSIALLVIFSIGVVYMHLILNLYLNKQQAVPYSLLYGFVIFIPVELLKITAAYPVCILIKKMYNR